MGIKHFKTAEFDAAVAAAPLAMVDFWADWCGPCKMLSPVIESLADQYEGKVLVGKVNVDEEPDLARRFGVMSIPTVVFLKNGQEFDRKVGVMPPQAFSGVLDTNLWAAPGGAHSPKAGNPLKQAGPLEARPASAWARRPSPRGGGELAFRCAPPFLLRPAGAAPPQGCPQPIRWRGNSGFRLVPSYHNGAQGLGLQGKRTAPGGRFQKTVGFRFAFSQEGEIQLEDPAGNYRLCDFTAGAFPDRAVLTVYWDLHRKTGMKAGPVHVDRACFHASMLMALTGQPSRASWAASSWPSGMPLPWASPSSPMWNTSGQVPAHRPQPMQFSFTVAFILVTPIIPEYFHPGPVSPPARE